MPPPGRAYRLLIRGQPETTTTFVEDSLVLAIGDAIGKRPITLAQPRKITLSWDRAFRVSIEVMADLGDPTNAFVRLGYELDGVPVDQHVRLMRTEQPTRWWFVCPFSDIRVAKLICRRVCGGSEVAPHMGSCTGVRFNRGGSYHHRPLDCFADRKAGDESSIPPEVRFGSKANSIATNLNVRIVPCADSA